MYEINIQGNRNFCLGMRHPPSGPSTSGKHDGEMSEEYIDTLVNREIAHAQAVHATQSAPVEADPMAPYVPWIAAGFISAGVMSSTLAITLTALI